jgi:hypothetical protein
VSSPKRSHLAPVSRVPGETHWSDLKRMDDSPLAFKEGGGRPSTAPMEKGTGLHAYLLGGESKVAIYTDGNRDERHGKYREFLAENPGKHILIPSQIETVKRMRDRVEANVDAMRLLEGAQETQIRWTTLGRKCAGTPDVVLVRDGKKVGVELKASQSVKPRKFFYKARGLFYHAQCAWYRDGINKTTAYDPNLGDCEEYYVIAVEMLPPFDCVVYQYDERSLELGHKINMLWLEKLNNCERSDFYPGYAQGIVPLSAFEDRDADEGSDGPDPLDWDGVEAAE